MILCIDSGNSRIKWGLHDGQGWSRTGVVSHADLSGLAALTQGAAPQRIIVSNVAGQTAFQAILEALDPWHSRVIAARSSPQAAGVTNHYENPLQLGVDRWSALIGARGLSSDACLVVMAGTATTIDTLDAAGNFRGGLILPGFDLMRRSLSRDTAALPLAEGRHHTYPGNTHDAIISGCLEAQAGAIERAFKHIAAHPGARCLLSGGAAPLLTPLLSIAHEQVDNLVLEGLARLAYETG